MDSYCYTEKGYHRLKDEIEIVAAATHGDLKEHTEYAGEGTDRKQAGQDRRRAPAAEPPNFPLA